MDHDLRTEIERKPRHPPLSTENGIKTALPATFPQHLDLPSTCAAGSTCNHGTLELIYKETTWELTTSRYMFWDT